MPQLLGIIYDLDGTLVDSAPDLQTALNIVLAEYGRREVTLLETQAMIGDGLPMTFKRACIETGGMLEDATSEKAFNAFVSEYKNIQVTPDRVYPGVRTSLTNFRALGIAQGVCTNKLVEPAKQILSDLGLIELFAFVGGCDTFSVCKPHGDAVLGVVSAMGCKAENCVMVGDSTNDILAAHAASVRAVAVTHGYGDAPNLGADIVISGFSELPRAFQSLGFDFAPSSWSARDQKGWDDVSVGP